MASGLLDCDAVATCDNKHDLRAGLDWIRPYARHGMLEWTRGDSSLHAFGRMLATKEPQGDEEELRDILLEATVENCCSEGNLVPALLLHEPAAWGPPDRTIAAASDRLAEGGSLLIQLNDGPDLERRSAEAVAALRSHDGLEVRESKGQPRGRISALRANARPRIALLPDGPGACTQIRTLGPFEELERRGSLELILLPADADEQMLVTQDLLVLQRFGGLPAVRMLLAARRVGIPVALELDDDFFNLPWYNPGAKAFRQVENRALLSALLRGVDTVVTSTPYLQQRMREYNDDVRTMHNLVDTTLFRRIRGPFHDPDTTTFGYIGTKTHSEDLRPVVGPLRELIAESGGKVRAVFIGHVPDELSRLPGVRYLGWFGTYQNAALALSRSGANVALAPLADLEFNRSKSAMKYLEYGACGIPGIFSDVEAYRGFVRNGDNGILVREHSSDAWMAAMRAIVGDTSGRERMADAAHKDVLDNHSIERRADDFLALYRGIMQNRPSGGARKPVDVPNRPNPLTVVLNLFGDAKESLPIIAAIAEAFPEGTQLIAVAEHTELADVLQLGGIIEVVRRDHGKAIGEELHGMAQALELARGDWVLCLEHGCRLPTDLLERLLPLTAPDIGAIGPRTDSPISAQDVGRIIAGRTGDRTEDLRAFARDTPATPAPWLEPGCVVLQRQATIAAGGIDPLLTWGDALIDLCVRLRARQQKVLVANSVLIASGTRHRSAHASPARRSESRRRLAHRLAETGQTVGVEPGYDPSPTYGLSGERLDVWVFARDESRYLDECLKRIAKLSDLPLTINVVHSHTLRNNDGNPLLDAALATRDATHAVLLHDGIMVTPGWLREMLTVLMGSTSPVVVPFANDGSPEQRVVVDRALSLDTLDEMTRARFGGRSDKAHTIRSSAGFCVLLDLARVRQACKVDGPCDLSSLTRPKTSGLLLAPRSYVHVLSHPDEAPVMQMGAFTGGPFDVMPAELPPEGCPPLSAKAFLDRVRPLLGALRENPGNATILAGLGRLYLHQGEVHTAMPFLERARKIDPFSPVVREAVAAARGALDKVLATR